jgi:hypothetical protein
MSKVSQLNADAPAFVPPEVFAGVDAGNGRKWCWPYYEDMGESPLFPTQCQWMEDDTFDCDMVSLARDLPPLAVEDPVDFIPQWGKFAYTYLICI